MIVAVHALTGGALSRLCRTPTQAFLVGALSHLVADALPHRDLGIMEETLLLMATLSVVTATQGAHSREFAGALGAAAPDIENLIARALRIPDDRLLLPTHRQYHGREVPSLRGQIALALGCLAVIVAPGLLRGAAARQRGNYT